MCDDVDDCVVQDGVSQECGCNTGITSGKCDCDGNVLDAINICGGSCVADADADGICDNLQGTVTDIDDNTYKTIIIGTQTWMAENLKTTKYKDGSAIPTGHSDSEWENLSTGAYAVYDNNPSNADIYGNLYIWWAVNDSKGLCMDGWHVPTGDEFSVLTDYLGSSSVAGGKMKATGTIEGGDGLWNAPNMDATNESGFTALPAGYRSGNYGTYHDMGLHGRFWSSTETWEAIVGNPMFLELNHDWAGYGSGGTWEESGHSVRCIKSAP